MPTVSVPLIQQAMKKAGFNRPPSQTDITNAQKYGLGIFSRQAAKMVTPKAAPLNELDQLQQQINAGQAAYNTTQQAQVQLPELVRTGLGQQSAEFNLPREALEARYGNPGSPLYIANPFVRQAVIEKATSGQQQAFTTVADRVNQALALRGTIQQQDLTGLKDKYGLLTDKQKAAEAKKQQDFENAYKLQQLELDRQRTAADMIRARNSGSGSGSGTTADSAANYASLVASGQLTLAQVPAAQRGAVVDYVAQNGVDILPPKARESIAAVGSAREVVDQIKQYSADLNKNKNTFSKYLGGIAASFRGKTGGTNKAAQASAALGDIKRGLASTLSRGLGEKGVLTDYDIKRAQALIPSPYDTRQEADRKLKLLDNFFNGIEERAYQTATGTPASLGLGGNSGKTSSGLTYTISK